MKQQLQQINRKLAFLFVFLLFSAMAMGQSRKAVTGTVTDKDGAALAGVSVLEKGTNNGASTNGDGKFSITVSEGATLRFSFLGFLTKEVTVGAQSTINVTLEDDSKALDEVVITGLGEQRDKKDLGYPTTTIKGEQIREANASNPISALQGLVPGMVVMPGQGGPQASPKFQIRGASSLFNGENTPLIVIDGIMLSDEVLNQSRGGIDGAQDFGNILKNINADDIENISVLRGGAVTALYGSRATNGVIIITTKKGYSQRGLGVSFSHDQSYTQAYQMPDMQREYGSGFTLTDFVKNGGMDQINPASYGFSFGPRLDGRTILDINGRQIPNSVLNNTLSLYETGQFINSNLSLQGGNERTTFRFSYTNNYNKGNAPQNRQTRNSFNFRGTQRLSDAVLLDATVSYNTTKGYNPDRVFGGSSILYGLTWGWPTNFDLGYWSKNYLDPVNGGIATGAGNPFGLNQYFLQLYHYEQSSLDNMLIGALNAKIDFTKWLNFEGNAGTNVYNVEREFKDMGAGVNFSGGNYSSSMSTVRDSRLYGRFTLKHTIKDFDLLLQLGSELTHSKSKSASYATSGGLRVPRQFRLSNSVNPATVSEGAPNIREVAAAFGQASIGYKQWLTLNLYGRNEWNSTLVYSNGTGNYSYFYPGADLSWSYVDAIKMPEIFSYGILRASYAITGGGTSVYRANTGYYTRQGTYVAPGGAVVDQYGFDSNTLGNLNLKPLRSYGIEFGTETRLFNDRLGIDFTWYKKNTKNQIINLAIPSESGATSALINSGDVQDKGFELTLTGTPIRTKNFSWNAILNYTRNRTRINSLAPGVTTVQLEGEDGIRTIARVGGEYSTMVAAYGFAKYQARDANGNPIDHPNNGKRVLVPHATGGAYYQRASNYANGLERETTIGSTLPKFFGSLRNVFRYKSFGISTMLDAKIGGYVYSNTYFYGSQTGNLANTLKYRTVERGGTEFTDPNNGNTRQVGVVLDGVYPDGTVIRGTNVSGWTHQQAINAGLAIPHITWRYYNNLNNWGQGIREMGAFKSSWVAVRDITVSYELPNSLTSKLKMNGVRLSAGVRNFGFLYNNAPDNMNVYDFTGTGASNAMIGGGTPYTRTFAFGINGTF